MNEIFIILALIVLNGIFAMSEIALVSARRSRLSSDSKKGNRSADAALRLSEQPDKFLSTVQIGITLIGILTGIYSGSAIATELRQWLEAIGVSSAWSSSIAHTVIVCIVTYLTLVFGELLPKRIGMSRAESVAMGVARPMLFLSRVASPFVWLLSHSTSLFARIFGVKEKESKVTEEEIKSIVKEGKDEGEVQPVEHDIVQRVFMLGDLDVDAIMTPRNDVVWIDVSATSKEVADIIKADLHDVYPVCDGDLDHVKGIVTLKKLFFSLHSTSFKISKIMSDAMFFYENMDVYKALEQMKSRQVNCVLVCDEFGSCVGIVTLKDIMDGLVGNIPDDKEEEPLIIPRTAGDGWLVDGQCPVYDFLKYFEAEDLYTTEDYNTVAGLCLDTLDHIPVSGEQVKWNMFEFEIVDMDGARIDKLLVKKTTTE